MIINLVKVGILNTHHLEKDNELIKESYDLLQEYGIDMTTFFRSLSKIIINDEVIKEKGQLLTKEEFVNYVIKYTISYKDKCDKLKPKLSCDQISKLLEMQSTNPHILSRYGIDQSMLNIQQEKSKNYENLCNTSNINDFENNKFKKILTWVDKYEARIIEDSKQSSNNQEGIKFKTNIFDKYNQFKINLNYHKPILENILKEDIPQIKSENNYHDIRRQIMNRFNPKFILRNYIAQKAIDKADVEDYSETERLLKVLSTPFDEHDEYAEFKYFDTSYQKATSFNVSCSS